MSNSQQEQVNNLWNETLLPALVEDFECTSTQQATNIIQALIDKLQQLDPNELVWQDID